MEKTKTTNFEKKIEQGFGQIIDGARLIIKDLYANGTDVFPRLNYRTGRYDPVSDYYPMAWDGFPWVGFLTSRLWLIYDYTKEDFFGEHALNIARKIGPFLSSRPLPYADAGLETYYGLCLGYEITGDNELKSWALSAVDNLMASYKPVPGAFFQHAEDLVLYIDMPFAAQCFFWAAKWDAKCSEPIIKCNDTILNSGLIREDGSTFHAVEFNSKTGDPIKLLTRQGKSDNSTWTRGQAWGIHNFTNAYEATREIKYLEAALKLTEWYINQIPEDFVPFYDFDDRDIDEIPRDSCSAAIVTNALVRLIRIRPDLKKNYQHIVQGTLEEIFQNYISIGGILLHGSWGRVRKSWNIGGFPQQDIMPYGNNWIVEVLYRLLNSDWKIYKTI